MNFRERIHEVLQEASTQVNELYPLIKGHREVGLSPDTLVALGKAMGALEMAKALVGRDIDDAQA